MSQIDLRSVNKQEQQLLRIAYADGYQEAKCVLSGEKATFSTHEPWPDSVAARLACFLNEIQITCSYKAALEQAVVYGDIKASTLSSE